MSNKSDSFYFDNFSACAGFSYDCAVKLRDILTDFNPSTLSTSLTELHAIENAADREKHAMTAELARAFITPIERDDIMRLSQTLDDVTDTIEDVLIKVYMFSVTEIRSDVLPMLDVIISMCDALKSMLVEFCNFKKSKTLPGQLININNLEEEGDTLYIAAMRALHSPDTGVRDIIVWRDIYEQLEKCSDTCEHVADIIEQVVIENT